MKKKKNTINYLLINFFSEYYSENYNAFIEILEKSELMRESLERMALETSQNNNKNSVLVDLILLVDVMQAIKNSKLILNQMIKQKMELLKNFKIQSSQKLNFQNFLISIQNECFSNEQIAEEPRVNENIKNFLKSKRNTTYYYYFFFLNLFFFISFFFTFTFFFIFFY